MSEFGDMRYGLHYVIYLTIYGLYRIILLVPNYDILDDYIIII